jgi:hypothetical protein
MAEVKNGGFFGLSEIVLPGVGMGHFRCTGDEKGDSGVFTGLGI